MTVRYRVRALRDIDAIYKYLHEQSPRGASNVLQAIHAAINLIAKQPYGSPRVEAQGIRVKVVRRYPYKIFYRLADEDQIIVLHIRHASRRPWP